MNESIHWLGLVLHPRISIHHHCQGYFLNQIMAENKFYPLSTITKRLQAILAPHIGKNFWVKAEISSGRERGGSFYCDLVETDQHGRVIAQMRCSIWERDRSPGCFYGIRWKRGEESGIIRDRIDLCIAVQTMSRIFSLYQTTNWTNRPFQWQPQV